MKNTSPVTALLFLGVATAVGAAAWMLSGSASDDGVVAPIERPTAQRSEVGFVAVSPKEQRKKANLEATKRQLKRIKELGTEISPGVYMVKDSSGDPTYYSTDLIEGRGRNGEPLFMTAEFKKIHTAPLRDGLGENGIKYQRLNPKQPKQTLSFGKKKAGGPSGSGATSGGPSDGGSSGAPGGEGGEGGGGQAPKPGDRDG